MLIGYILLGMFVICTLFSAASGASPAAGGSVMEGAQEAVSFCVSVAGGVCLWSAVLELMERCGVSAALSRALRPLLRGLFPRAAEDAEILAALSENVGANLLGLVMSLMEQAEKKFDDGATRKEWVMAMVKASADYINYPVDEDTLSKMIDSLCDMSKVVNGKNQEVDAE